MYYRYGELWETFFRILGCKTLIGEGTHRDIVDRGSRQTVDESCMPLKVFMGQVSALVGRCDRILVPRFERIGPNDEFCVRFFGLEDMVRHTFPKAQLLGYSLGAKVHSGEPAGFLRMGLQLGKCIPRIVYAYRQALGAQQQKERAALEYQRAQLHRPGLKILLAAQPYVLHDSLLGRPVVRMVEEQGGIPLYSDRFDKAECRRRSGEISRDLYWMMNKEILGAIAAHKEQADGIVLLTAFPCGTDCLANELALRRVKDIPIIPIILDEQQGEAGLQTRIESFLDILKQRKSIR